LKNDPNEWYNLAGREKYQSIINEMQKTAPETFSPIATPRDKLKLVVTGDTFHWEQKEDGTPDSVEK